MARDEALGARLVVDRFRLGVVAVGLVQVCRFRAGINGVDQKDVFYLGLARENWRRFIFVLVSLGG